MDKSNAITLLKDLLPIDDDSLGQMVDNALNLSSQTAITDYWLGLLGESPDALDFIAKFTSKLTNPNSVNTVKPKSNSSQAPILKPSSPSPSSSRNNTNPWNQPIMGKPKLNNKPRLSKNTNATTSQLLDKPQEKPSKQSAKREKQKKIDNLKDLDEILKQLEINESAQNVDEKVICNCMATRHPLFEAAPNCLNCGKIICVKEGYRPCSYCGHELISFEEKNQIITMLRNEKNEIESPSRTPEPQQQQSKLAKKKKVTIGSGAGINLWTQQEAMFKKLEAEDSKKAAKLKKQNEEAKQKQEQNEELKYYNKKREIDPDLLKAQANLDNLLNFQSNSAERTKIIDQASDFEIPTGSNLSMWSSSVEKALQLKKQQKQMRKLEKKQKELVGRGKKVMEMSIGKDGKVIMKERLVQDNDSEDEEVDQDIKNLEQDIQQTKNKSNEEAFQNVWDYEKDQNKWEKPVYSGASKDTDSSTTQTPKHSKWERVQLLGTTTTDDLEEIVVGM